MDASPMDMAMEDIAKEMARDDVILDLLSKDRRDIPYFASSAFCVSFLKQTVDITKTVDVVTTIFGCKSDSPVDPLSFYGIPELTQELQVRMRYKRVIAVPFLFSRTDGRDSHANMIIISRLEKSVIVEHFEPFGANSEYIPNDIFGQRMYSQCEKIFSDIFGIPVIYYQPIDFQKTWYADLNIQTLVSQENKYRGSPLVWTLTCMPISIWYAFKRLQQGMIYSEFRSVYKGKQKYIVPLTTVIASMTQQLNQNGNNGNTPSQTIINLIKDQLQRMTLQRDISYFEPPGGTASFIYVYHSWGMDVTRRPLTYNQFIKQTPYQKVQALTSLNFTETIISDNQVRLRKDIYDQIQTAMIKYFNVYPSPNQELNWYILTKGSANKVVAFFAYQEFQDHIEIYNVCSPILAPIKDVRSMSYIKYMLSKFLPAKPQYIFVQKDNYYFVNAVRAYYSVGFRLYQIDDTPNKERIFMVRQNIVPTDLLAKFDIVPDIKRRYVFSTNTKVLPIVNTIDELLTKDDRVANIDGSYYQLNPIWRNLLSYLEIYDKDTLDKSLVYLYLKDRASFDRFKIKPVEGPVFYDIYLQPIIIPVPRGMFYTSTPPTS